MTIASLKDDKLISKITGSTIQSTQKASAYEHTVCERLVSQSPGRLSPDSTKPEIIEILNKIVKNENLDYDNDQSDDHQSDEVFESTNQSHSSDQTCTNPDSPRMVKKRKQTFDLVS